MNRVGQFSFVGLLLISSGVFPIQPNDNWYGGVTGFLSMVSTLNNVPLRDPRTKATGLGDITYEIIGGGGGGEIGYRYENFRAEGELIFNINIINEIQLNGLILERKGKKASSNATFSINGQTSFGAGFINAYYDIFEEEGDTPFVPYLGAGIGYAAVGQQVSHFDHNQAIVIHDKLSADIGAAQVILGCSYFIDSSSWLGLDYRYIHSQQIKALGFGLRVSTINLSLNYAFDCSDENC